MRLGQGINAGPALASASAGAAPRTQRRGISFSHILMDGVTGPRETDLYAIDGDAQPEPD